MKKVEIATAASRLRNDIYIGNLGGTAVLPSLVDGRAFFMLQANHGEAKS